MRKRIAIYGASDEALTLARELLANPRIEIAAIVDSDLAVAKQRVARLPDDLRDALAPLLASRSERLASDPSIRAVIDAGRGEPFAVKHPQALERGLEVVTPLTAKLLWGFAGGAERRRELLDTLHRVLESVDFTVDFDELCQRVLEIAREVTGAEGGSLLLLEPGGHELLLRAAAGVEAELWDKIRVPLGQGIAGRAAAERRALRVRGKADRQAFQILHERQDVEAALCVPLIHADRVIGVLNLHSNTRPDAFSDEDLAFAERLAALDARLLARAIEHDSLRNQAARFDAVREIQRLFEGREPMASRLHRLCLATARRAGGGIAQLYLFDADEGQLRLAASSLESGALASDVRVPLGAGLDGRAAATREPIFAAAGGSALAYAALPLVAADRLIAVLSVQTGAAAPRGRGGRDLLLELASAAAEGIARVQREAAASQRAEKVGAISETGIRLVSAGDATEVLRLGTSNAAMVLEADHAVLRLQDEETGRYVIRSYFGAADGRAQERLFRLDKRVSVAVIKRRALLCLRDASQDPDLRAEEAGVRSILAAPLSLDERVIGTLCLYDKVATDRFATLRFAAADEELFRHFASYLERALATSLRESRLRQFRNVDDETGLPNAAYLVRRIDQEIARADGRDAALALAVCCVENLDELERSGGPEAPRRLLHALAESLRRRARSFDVAARTGRAEFSVLLPDPGAQSSELIFGLARAVAEDVAGRATAAEPRASLAFGHALYPQDGADRESLLARAREPRIRMV
jgi:GAF domain-containing protein